VSLEAGETKTCFEFEVPTGVRWARSVVARGSLRVAWEATVVAGDESPKVACESAVFDAVLDDSRLPEASRAVGNMLVEIEPLEKEVWSRHQVRFAVRLKNVGTDPLRVFAAEKFDYASCTFHIYGPGSQLPSGETVYWPLKGTGNLVIPPGESRQHVFSAAWGVYEVLSPGPDGHVGHERRESTFLVPGPYRVVAWFHAEDHSEKKGCWTGYVRSNVATVTLLASPLGRGEVVRTAAVSPDGRLVAVAGHDKASVQVWDVPAKRRVRTLEPPDPVRSLAFSADRKCLAFGTDRGVVGLWDLPTGRARFSAKAHPGSAYAVAMSPDGRLLASGGEGTAIFLWDAASGEEVHRLEFDRGTAKSLCFSPDGRRLAACFLWHGPAIRVWEVAAGRIVSQAPPEPRPRAVALSPDGKTLATIGNGPLRLRDAATCGDLRQPRILGDCIAFSPDGRLMATGGVNATLKLWQADTGAEVELKGYRDSPVYAVGFSADGRTLVSVRERGSILTFDVPAE
jgi:hypothetical protein